MLNYAKRLTEVDEVLNHLSEEDYNKIPEDVMNTIKKNKDDNYVWKYDETKELKDQGLSEDSLAILSYINLEYLLNEEQKKYMEKIYELNEIKYRQEMSKKKAINKEEQIPPQNIQGPNITQPEKIEAHVKEQRHLVESKPNIFSKIINKIKYFLKRK